VFFGVVELENSLERNNQLRDMVERRLGGGGAVVAGQSGRTSTDRWVDTDDDQRMRTLESQLEHVEAENRALKSHQMITQNLLASSQQTNTRFAPSS